MRKFIRMNEVIELAWDDAFEPLLKRLNEIFQGLGSINNRQCAARAILLIIKQDTKPIAADVLRRVREEDDASPLGPRVGYDETNWMHYIGDAVTALTSDDPYKALIDDFNR